MKVQMLGICNTQHRQQEIQLVSQLRTPCCLRDLILKILMSESYFSV